MTETDILARARAGLREIEQSLAEVAGRLRSARAVPKPELADATEHALTCIQAGDPVPDDLSARVLAQRRQNEGAQVEAQVLAAVEQRLKARLWELHRHAGPGLEVLRDELDELLAAARPVLGELGEVGSAGEAIASDRVDAWRRATALAERYTELRAGQLTIVSASLTPADNRLSDRITPEARALTHDYGHVKDAPLHGTVGDAAANRADQRTSRTQIINGRVVETAHTEKPARRRPWLSESDLENFKFITRPGVTAWVPDIAALLASRDEHAQRLRDEARAAAEPPRRAERAPSRPPVAAFPRDH